MIARFTRFFALATLALANLLLASYSEPVRAEDTDIFTVNPNITSLRPNVLIIQDNTANWNTPFAAEKAALVSTVNGSGRSFQRRPDDLRRNGRSASTERSDGGIHPRSSAPDDARRTRRHWRTSSIPSIL